MGVFAIVGDHIFAPILKLFDFMSVHSLTVCNDIAERGVALISAFIKKAQSEEQVVEFHRT